ncbi:MAG: DNA cytosine methyltransferase [Burkholderiaceae bacterium]|nr:DNA cytosine methyltransferase [Burkholderiaceae bacterium]
MLGEGLRAGLRHMGVETRTVCYVEREGFAASVMATRMAEGALDDAPVWSDVTTFDAAAWRGAVDCVIGGFPCQDLSLAGRRAGLDGKRSGLFFELLRIAEDSGARYLFLENVAGIASATATVVDEAEGELEERAAARVLGELADRGWCAEWLTLSASEVGASHGRARWFCWAWRVVRADLPGREAFGPQPERAGQCDETGVRGCHVAHAQRAERRPLSVAGTGGQQGNDTGGREAHGRAGVAGEVLECEFCGHEFPEHLGRYGCPNREGAGLADTEGHGRHEGRPKSGGEQGRSDAAECGGAMAYAQRQCRQRRGVAGNMACAGCTAEDQTRQREWCGSAVDDCSQPMANACSPRRQGAELAGACAGHGWGAGSTWTS